MSNHHFFDIKIFVGSFYICESTFSLSLNFLLIHPPFFSSFCLFSPSTSTFQVVCGLRPPSHSDPPPLPHAVCGLRPPSHSDPPPLPKWFAAFGRHSTQIRLHIPMRFAAFGRYSTQIRLHFSKVVCGLRPPSHSDPPPLFKWFAAFGRHSTQIRLRFPKWFAAFGRRPTQIYLHFPKVVCGLRPPSQLPFAERPKKFF